jgi:transcriptional regulator with XRE-family HTH domain
MSKEEENQAFAARLQQAIAAHPLAPEGHGSLTWLRNRLEEAGTSLSINTIHKWATGQSRPRHDKLLALAASLGVDEAWLSVGSSPAPDPKLRKDQVRRAEGAALVLAGLVRLAGGSIAFPGEDDTLASENHIHLYAIINAEQVRVTTAPGAREGDTVVFNVPRPVGNNKVVGVLGDLAHVAAFDLTDASPEICEVHEGFTRIQVNADALIKGRIASGIKKISELDQLSG